MNTFWNIKTKNIVPYVAGEQPKNIVKLIKLNTNENPYPPSDKAIKALKEFDADQLRLYPNTNASLVCETVAKINEKYGIKKENVFVGNGSDEVLAICWQTFFERKDNTDLPVLSPDISYSFYPVYSDMYDVNLKKIPLNDDFMINVNDYIGVDNCGVVIANPNAPTSVALIGLDDIRRILDNNRDSVVIIDEAYIAFARNPISAVELVNEYDNLVVVQTLSKAYSLAGIRVGYAIANEELIVGMRRIRDSFNSYPVDRIAEIMAANALLDQKYYNETRNRIIDTRDWFVGKLEELGFYVLPSSANFVFAKPTRNGMNAEEVYNKLRQKGIIVRYFNKEKINEYLRISIGTQSDMETTVEVMKGIINE